LTKLNYLPAAIAALLLTAPPALSGPNDFFGGSIPTPGADPMSAGGMAPPAMPPGGDYSEDEKRMQKKYKASLNHARELISKGDKMMKLGESKHSDKIFKKGKIIKDIGEKRLAELEANNPFPEMNQKKAAKGKESTEPNQQ
jgi:hypothetical protein